MTFPLPRSGLPLAAAADAAGLLQRQRQLLEKSARYRELLGELAKGMQGDYIDCIIA